MTVDDENNIIDDEDEAKSAEQDNHHHHQPTCQNTIEHPPLPVISSEQQLPPTAAPAAEAVTGFCGVCKLVFSSESQLADHRLAYAQKIACCHCLKTFATMAKLRAHHRTTTGKIPQVPQYSLVLDLFRLDLIEWDTATGDRKQHVERIFFDFVK